MKTTLFFPSNLYKFEQASSKITGTVNTSGNYYLPSRITVRMK